MIHGIMSRVAMTIFSACGSCKGALMTVKELPVPKDECTFVVVVGRVMRIVYERIRIIIINNTEILNNCRPCFQITTISHDCLLLA